MQVNLKNLFQAIKKTVDQFPLGKTNLSFLIATGLSNAGMTSVFKQYHMQQMSIDDEHHLHLFHNHQGIILEINHEWLSSISFELQQLFKKLNQVHRQLRISGFLFFVDISTLMIQDHSEQSKIIKKQAKHAKRFIAALDYPVRSGLVITKLDQVTGFTDFFSMAHELELNEPLGFSLSTSSKNPRFNHFFSELWSTFVGNLNQSMLQKIHTTRANKKRILIREFPLQMAVLEAKFLHMIKQIGHERTHIHGIYFTCAEQKGRNFNYLNQKIKATFSLMVPISSIQSVNFRAFFIQGAINHCQELSTYTPSPKIWRDKKNLCILGFGAVASIWLMLKTIESHYIIENTHHNIEQTYLSSNTSPYQKLKYLEFNLENLQSMPLLFRHIVEVKNLTQHMNESEKNIYEKTLVNEMNALIQYELQNKDVLRSYEALKVYKSIVQKRQNETAYIIHWFERRMLADKKDTKFQMSIIKRYLWTVNWPVDNHIIDSTEALLNALPKDYLIYQMAKEQLLKNTINFSVPGFEPSQIQIPKAYTKKGYPQTKEGLLKALKKFEEESWVLHTNFEPGLQDKILDTYAREYIHWWKHFVEKLHPIRFTNLEEGRELLNNIGKNKTLENIIHLMASETAPNQKSTKDDFNTRISSQFSDLLFAKNQQKEIEHIWKILNKFIGMFLVLNDNGQASFQYMRAFFNQIQYNDTLHNVGEVAKHLPEPSATWVKQIHDDIWLSLQQTTKQYINQKWQENIYKTYQNEIENRYPFANYKEEVSIERFEEFFAPNGRIQYFFREYLQPFINTNQPQWDIKQIEEKQFPIKKEIIEELIQANVITNTFFPNNDPKCSVDFSIEKMSLDPVINELVLTIGSQTFKDSQQENLYENNLHWPVQDARLQIHTIDGQNFDINEHGIWALFRILQQVNVLPEPNDPSVLQILLEINGNSGRYILKTTHPMNPYSPGILNGFKLEEKVM